MWSKRHEVDYGLQRRRALRQTRDPLNTKSVACDADPMLIRAALHHGEPAKEPCPVCGHRPLLLLNYVFGTQLGQYSGRIKSGAELAEMENEFGEFTVRVVEVCSECSWNHMIYSYVLGDGVTRKPPRRQRTVEDIYG